MFNGHMGEAVPMGAGMEGREVDWGEGLKTGLGKSSYSN